MKTTTSFRPTKEAKKILEKQKSKNGYINEAIIFFNNHGSKLLAEIAKLLEKQKN